MSQMLHRLRSAFTALTAETRYDFVRVDASPALPDDGSWLTPRR